MGVHRNPKSEEDLILEDKLDLARTLVRLSERASVRRKLNAIEPALVEAHSQEVQSGTVSKLEVDLDALFRKEIEPERSDT